MANVPMMEKGSARLGMTVAETLRRNRKITIDHQAERQQHGELNVLVGLADGVGPVVRECPCSPTRGISERNFGSRFFTASVTAMVLVPGWRWMPRMMARCVPCLV